MRAISVEGKEIWNTHIQGLPDTITWVSGGR